MIRHDWTLAEVRAIHDLPLLDLLHRAQRVHREHFSDNKVQLCSLLSVKTGGCPEDCAYCPQAARYHTGVQAEPLLSTDEVLAAARKAREAGATRFCMGAAWREVKDGPQFDRLLELARQDPQPESVPINMLVRVQGTPLFSQQPVSTIEMVRMIATARILMPRSMVRLSAGREQLSEEAQLLCMLAGANSVFFGEKLLTTGNPAYEQDMALFEAAGIAPLEPRP